MILKTRRSRERSGGYGLHIVDRIADDWGVKHASMHVWFDLSY
jgi:hypothetical protein